MSISSNLSFSPSSPGVDRVDVVNATKEQKHERVAISTHNFIDNGCVDISSDAVSGDAMASSEATAEKNPAMTTSVSDSQHPEAHLEALDTIITCTTLLQSTTGDGQASIAALLRQAKSLLLDNTVTVILATLRELHRQEEGSQPPRLPTFWSQVQSPKELTSWLQLFDMILYCWGGQHGEAPAFVERYVRAYTEEIRQLRQLHTFDMSDLLDGGVGGTRRVQERLDAVKAALRPAHWTLVTGMKKFNRGKLEQLWHVLTACLQLCGCLDMNSLPCETNSPKKPNAAATAKGNGGATAKANAAATAKENTGATSGAAVVPLEDMKAALTKLTFAHLDVIADFEKLSKNETVLRKIRREWLPSPSFDETKLRSLDLSNMANSAWHSIPALAADFVAYLRAVEELARLRDRLSMREEATIRDTIHMRLLSMAAGQMTSIRRHQQWQKVPKELKDSIGNRRQEMAARCSVSGGVSDTLLSPTSSTASSAASASMSFSVNLESSVPIKWNLSFVKNSMANIL